MAVIIVALALPLLALSGCGGEARQTDASAADVAAFIEVLVPAIASSECADLAEAAQQFEANTSGKVDFQKSAEEFQRFAHEAPAEIQDDLQAFADPYSNWAKALEATEVSEGLDVTKPTPKTLEKLQKVSAAADALEARIDRQEMQRATHHIFAWMRMNCT
jgi:ABC-type microcin C transport system duplicated ATPase subunit YejF